MNFAGSRFVGLIRPLSTSYWMWPRIKADEVQQTPANRGRSSVLGDVKARMVFKNLFPQRVRVGKVQPTVGEAIDALRAPRRELAALIKGFRPSTTQSRSSCYRAYVATLSGINS